MVVIFVDCLDLDSDSISVLNSCVAIQTVQESSQLVLVPQENRHPKYVQSVGIPYRLKGLNDIGLGVSVHQDPDS